MTARARRTDVATSHEAARAMNRTGRAKFHVDLVMAVVQQQPGLTAPEIAEHVPFDSVEVTRRLGDLQRLEKVRKGQPRPCRARGGNRKFSTWRPAAADGFLFDVGDIDAP